MKIKVIDTGLFKLDGGAMFGVVPKTMWQKLNPPDENNLCTWAMRCLLIESGDRKILVDTGIGLKQDEKFRSHFEPHGEDDLFSSLAKHGLTPAAITDVFLTHLHFDHCGGAVHYNEERELVASFPNATYWTNQKHYDWALQPNPREKASFLKENFVPLADAGKLQFIDSSTDLIDWIEGIQIQLVYGHTEAMMMLIIPMDNGKKLVYCADLIPSSFHIGLPYVMSYDLRPLVTMKEKERLLEAAVANDYYLFFEHDPLHECATVYKTDRGRIRLKAYHSLAQLQAPN
ncbi:MAG: MBL fold metallo-hydrolase [Saprospiraceae bacterium]